MFNRASEAGAVGVYAALQVLQQAIETVGEIDRKKIRDEIASGTFKTIWGDAQVQGPAATPIRGRSASGRTARSSASIPANKPGAQAAAVPEAEVVVSGLRPSAGPGDLRPDPVACGAGRSRVILFEVFLNGLLLGGMYGLVALGLNLQYGVARMLNLSYGEFFMGGAFAAFFDRSCCGSSIRC